MIHDRHTHAHTHTQTYANIHTDTDTDTHTHKEEEEEEEEEEIINAIPSSSYYSRFGSTNVLLPLLLPMFTWLV